MRGARRRSPGRGADRGRDLDCRPPGRGRGSRDPGGTGKAICWPARRTRTSPRWFERSSRFVVLVKVRGKDSTSVVDALTRCARRLPRGLMTSLTWDRGNRDGAARGVYRGHRYRRCTSAIPAVRGNAAAMKTRTDCCANTSRKASSCRKYSQRQLDAVAPSVEYAPATDFGLQNTGRHSGDLCCSGPVDATSRVAPIVGRQREGWHGCEPDRARRLP